MAIPEIKKQDVLDAIKFIDEHGVPNQNKSTRYKLCTEDGKMYPPRYVIAVANHLANGEDIIAEGYNSIEAINFLKNRGFHIETVEEKYELTITADKVTSTDSRFTLDNLGMGDDYKPLDSYFERANGEIIRRAYSKNERKNSNQTMPRIACQVFEKQIAALSMEETENFPICQYTPNHEVIRGIFTSVEELKKRRNSLEYMVYTCADGSRFAMYCWNVFSTILFVQECLKRFGSSGDRFVLSYCEKEEKETKKDLPQDRNLIELDKPVNDYRNPYSVKLIESKNIIFRGAPGTGKSYLAKEIAADIISNGCIKDYAQLSDEQKKQMEFVQFHPSYDYSDFVEGLRPKINNDGSMGFELQDGIFKRFVERARKNYENSQKSKETIEKENSAQDAMNSFFSNVELGVDVFRTVSGNEFTITGVDEEHIDICIPGNALVKNLRLSVDEIREMLESGKTFEKVRDVTRFFGKAFATQGYSYDFALYNEICVNKNADSKTAAEPEKLKNYVFIIDEINRGEISKIFGELFFAIDPSYRGTAGEVSTQYSNLHTDPSRKFFIPENVYIIGTMNDIDKSVDSFDFAMRRRFRFIEIKADENLEMLETLKNEGLKAEAIRRMKALNQEIVNTEDLNENYQIGASYFLKLKTLNFDQLWTDYLEPLLQEYVQGMYDEKSILERFAKAYGYSGSNKGNDHEAAQN